MNKSGELLNRYVVQARMSEVATGLSLVAALVGFWPAWALVPIYGAMAVSSEYKKYHLKSITLSHFEPKPVKKRLRRPE